MRKQVLWMASAALIAFQVPGANASTFDWSFTGAGGGSGTFTASLVSGDQYLVSIVTGTVNGQSIGLIEPVNDYGSNTNTIFYPSPSGPLTLGNGVEFTCPSCGGVDMLFAFGGGNWIETGMAGFSQTDTLIQFTGSLEVAQTPLPAALPLFATGLGALGLLGWRRKRKTSAAIAA
jgi:hypothetical protein